MALSPDHREHIKAVADDTLVTFKSVAKAANSALNEKPSNTEDILLHHNTLTSPKPAQSLSQINYENKENYRALAGEPAIARVVGLDESGSKCIYYICRFRPDPMDDNDIKLASYGSPVGRIASLPVGGFLQLPGGTIEVFERAELKPALDENGWDSIKTILERNDYGSLTIDSLRSFLNSFSGDATDEDLLSRQLAEENDLANIREGKRRSVINKIMLRDQPILDQYQDEIFRLPLDSSLLILGPPGTGKTTTLIRRLGQKLNPDFLSDDEKSALNSARINDMTIDDRSWMMFTPTELLKQYVKEAFARENIPASDKHIRTWSDTRRDLARNELGVLRTGSGRGIFSLNESARILTDNIQEKAISWFSDFNAFQKSSFIDDTRRAAHELSNYPEIEINQLGQQMLSTMERAGTTSLSGLFILLNEEVSSVQAMITKMKSETDKKINGSLNRQINLNNTFLNDLAKFIGTLNESSDDESDAEIQDDEEERTNQPQTPRLIAQFNFVKAVRAQARAQAKNKSLGKGSRNSKIIEWLGDRTLNESDRAEVGASLLIQSNARHFINPVNKFMNGIPKRYREFRRLRQTEGKWFKPGELKGEINPLELDVILLSTLRCASDLLRTSGIVRNIDNALCSSLKPIHALYKVQVLVDEATDFSPLQIACMEALGHPRVHSFFACGDFNQRLTAWGSRSIEDIEWVSPDIEIKHIKIAYRQSRQLNDLAKAIIQVTDGFDSDVVLPEKVDNEGVSPVLAEELSTEADIAIWLAERIIEIESFVQPLPSIAILVNGEEKVQGISKELNLNEKLSSINIRVTACPNGQVIGQENDVRVFDVQHIKGLEFEAIFFIGIDQLESMHPGLSNKYLYVGTTRAATYLGVTCNARLPKTIAGLKPMFENNWESF